LLPFSFSLQISLILLILGQELVKSFLSIKRQGRLGLFYTLGLFQIGIELLQHALLFLFETFVQIGLDFIARPEFEFTFRGVAIPQSVNFWLTVGVGSIQRWVHGDGDMCEIESKATVIRWRGFFNKDGNKVGWEQACPSKLQTMSVWLRVFWWEISPSSNHSFCRWW
jgi:hypothetical protein